VNIAWTTYFARPWKVQLYQSSGTPAAVVTYTYISPVLTSAGMQWESYRCGYRTGDGETYYLLVQDTTDTDTNSYTNKASAEGIYVDWWEEEFVPAILTTDVIEYGDGATCFTSAGAVKWDLEVDGPVTLWMKPGLNLLYVAEWGYKGVDDYEATDITQTVNVSVDHAPRYVV
jgi:hypothetical protein